MSVNSHLTDLASSLVLNSVEKASIASSISTLSTRLDSWFETSLRERFQFGSSKRETILPRKADKQSDVDYMVVFSTTDGKKKPQTYLDRLKKFAEEKYASSEIHQSHPTVVLQLNHINFELVPAVNESGYQIPSPSSSYIDWIYTDPAAADKAILDKNKAESYQLKPLVRLVKYWNAINGYPFYSFSLEQSIVRGWYQGCTALKDYFYSFWSSFSCPIDAAQYVKDKVNTAKQRAQNAKDYEAKDMPITAEAEIKKIVPPL